MNNRQRDQFDLGMKSLLDMEKSLKELQGEYERGVVSGLSRDDLAALEAKISKKYSDTEDLYLSVLQLIQAAIMFPITNRLEELG